MSDYRENYNHFYLQTMVAVANDEVSDIEWGKFLMREDIWEMVAFQNSRILGKVAKMNISKTFFNVLLLYFEKEEWEFFPLFFSFNYHIF